MADTMACLRNFHCFYQTPENLKKKTFQKWWGCGRFDDRLGEKKSYFVFFFSSYSDNFWKNPMTRSLYSSLIKSYAGGTDKPTDNETYRLNWATGWYSAKLCNIQQEEIFTKIYIELVYWTGESVQVR